MIYLRKYQDEAINGIRAAFSSGKKTPLFVLPTGGGKTITFCYIASGIKDKEKRAYILVHRQELVKQVSDTLTDFEIEHGIIAAGSTNREYKSAVQVCSVQTLASRIKKGIAPPAPDLLIIDEAHHATATTWRNVLTEYKAARVLGVTATPCRTDGTALGEVFDSIVEGPTILELIEGGHLAMPRVFAPPANIDTKGLRKNHGDWNANKLAERVNKPTITGDAIQHYKKHADGMQAVVFCCNIAHANEVAAQFTAAGIGAETIHGKLSTHDRRAMVKSFSDGKLKILTSVDLIGEGFDVPAIGAAILLRPTQSLSLYLQQCGRALRAADGKTHAVILDHVGNTARHGLPIESYEWSLDGKPKIKRGAGKFDGIAMKICDKCYAAYIGSDCTECGNENQNGLHYKQVDGHLKEIDMSAEKIAEIKKQRRREIGQAQTLEALINLGNERGYKNPRHWARQILQGRTSRNAGGIRSKTGGFIF